MYKLIAFVTLLAAAAAAPAPEPKAYPPVVVHPVVPVVSSHSSIIRTQVAHPVPVYHPAPVVVKHAAYVKPVYPVVHPVPVVHAPVYSYVH